MIFSREEIINKLKEILISNLDDDNMVDVEIGLDDNLVSLGLNSITFIKVVVECEKAFDIEFDDEELDYEVFDTLEKICNCIESKVSMR